MTKHPPGLTLYNTGVKILSLCPSDLEPCTPLPRAQALHFKKRKSRTLALLFFHIK